MKVWQPTDYYDVATEFTRISTFIFDICGKLGIYDSLDKHTWSTSDIPYYEDYKKMTDKGELPWQQL